MDDVVGAWLAGRPTENLELIGLTMVFWGRLGKSLLYLAGLTVVLDLADPDNLRARGRQTIERAHRLLGRMRHKRQVGRLVGIQEDVIVGIVRVAHRYGRSLVTQPPVAVPPGLRLELGRYRDFHSAVIGALPTKHTCPHQHGLSVCTQQFEYAVRQINNLIAEQLPAEERDLIRDVEASRRSISPLLIFLAAAIGGIGALSSISRGREGQWVFVGLLVVSLLAFVVAVLPGMQLLTAAAGYRVWGALLSGYGRLLDQTRPLRLLRWVAAVLFVIGGLFDLLAS
ncbi:hypothetical protein [Micromonospora sp. NPDC005237]|uniref:hypothetical protein n=1 Tax=Micromonospora sp. NPDC005237 TaxID=3155113 RepID=UPI0033ABD2A4